MSKKELFQQLHNFKTKIRPDSSWKSANREILVAQIKAQTNFDFEAGKGRFSKLFANKFLLFVYKPIVTSVAVLLVILSAWIASVSATKNSLPGDLFYGVKLTAERMQINLATNDEKRTNLEIVFASRRLDEIKKVVGKNNSEQTKKKNLDLSLKSFQESINNVKSNLAKLEKVDSKAAVTVANLVGEKTKEYVGILENQQAKTPDLASNADAAITDSKATGDKALSVILTEFEAGNKDVFLDDVKQKINDRIDDLAKNAESAKADIEKIIVNKKIADDAAAASAAAKALADKKAAEEKAAADAKAAAEKQVAEKVAQDEAADIKLGDVQTDTSPANVNADNTNANVNATSDNTNSNVNATSDNTNSNVNTTPDNTNTNQSQSTDIAQPPAPVEVLPSIEDIKDKPKEAEALLNKAKDFLKNSSVSQAFDQMGQADDIMTLVNKVIKANSQYLVDEQSQSDNNQADANTTDTKAADVKTEEIKS